MNIHYRYHAGDFKSAFKYAKRAAELGDDDANHNLAVLYLNPRFGFFHEKRAVYHFEQAAIAGHPDSRNNLGRFELFNNNNLDRAIKHWSIAANLGHDLSLAELKLRYKSGLVGKDILAAALRGHQAAVDATKSPQREAAEAAQKRKAARAARQRR